MPSKVAERQAKAAAKRIAASATVSQPDWPPLQPLVPTVNLVLDQVLEDQIVLIRNLFTASLCQRYVSFLSTLNLITTPTQPKKGEALRVNDRFRVDDPHFAEQLWSETGLKQLVTDASNDWGGEVCGLNPAIRIYRYRKGQFFGQHYDESNTIVIPGSPTVPAKTTWTLLIYLTGSATGCVGGETVFYPEFDNVKSFKGKSKQDAEPIVIGLEAGMALLHKHGNDCLLHEGRKVTAGEKWVIRSDLCVKR